MSYPSSLMSPSSTGGGMNLEVWFSQPDEATVFLESSITDPDDEKLYETMIFGLFAARHICNNRKGFASQSLAQVLFSFDEHEPLPQVLDALGEVKVGSPTVRGGRKGFICTFRPDERAFFKLHPKGFGMLGKGVDYYAPTSALALLVWLLQRREEDDRYQFALGMTAKMVGAAGVSGQITITTQSDIALQAASAGWFHPDDLIPDGEEVSDEVREICREHEMEFGELYAEARRQINAVSPETSEGEILIMETAAVQRMCRSLCIIASERIDSEDGAALGNAAEANTVAIQTGNQQLMETSEAHYNKLLEQAIEKAGLAPVVEALEGMILTDNLDEAAH